MTLFPACQNHCKSGLSISHVVACWEIKLCPWGILFTLPSFVQHNCPACLKWKSNKLIYKRNMQIKLASFPNMRLPSLILQIWRFYWNGCRNFRPPCVIITPGVFISITIELSCSLNLQSTSSFCLWFHIDG